MTTFAKLLAELAGCRVSLLTRAAGLLMIGFSPDGVNADAKPTYSIHASCPVRFVHEHDGRIWLGSADLDRSKAEHGEWSTAFDEFHTMYDSQAAKLLEMLGEHDVRVTGAHLELAGDLIVELTGGLRIEILPMSSGPHEMWRLFTGQQHHFVYPEDFPA